MGERAGWKLARDPCRTRAIADATRFFDGAVTRGRRRTLDLGMNSVVLLVVIIGGAVGVMYALKELSKGKGRSARPGKERGAEPLPYRRKDFLLTAGERAFLGALDMAAGSEARVFAKVRLADLVWMGKGVSGRVGHQNRVNMKHVDFVVCEAKTLRPWVAVELDDSTHEREERKARDEFVEEALKAAGLPLVRVRARGSGYVVEELRRELRGAIEGAGRKPSAIAAAG